MHYALSLTGKEGEDMITFGELIAVISLCVSCFMLGYRIGRDQSSDEKDLKQK